MNRGQVYLWIPDSQNPLGGKVQKAIVPLSALTPDPEGRVRLSNRLVRVCNGGWVNVPDFHGGVRAVAIS